MPDLSDKKRKKVKGYFDLGEEGSTQYDRYGYPKTTKPEYSTSHMFFGRPEAVIEGSVPRWTPWQQRLGQTIGSYLRSPQDQPYSGRLPGTVDLSDLEQMSLGGLERMFSGEGILEQQQEQLQQRMDPNARAEEIERYFQEAVSEPMWEEFREETIPEIRGRYAPSGFWSGQRVEAEENAMEDLIDSLSRERAGLAYQERRDALEAMGMVPQSFQTELQGQLGRLEAGAVPREVEEQGLQSVYQEWLRQSEERDQWVDQVLNALNLQGFDTYAFGTPSDKGILGEMGSSSSCFITTAAVKHMGLEDDCDELQTLRWFRDNVMPKFPRGKWNIKVYYNVAPYVVKSLDTKEDADRIYRSLYNGFIYPAVQYVKHKAYEKAYQTYKDMFIEAMRIAFEDKEVENGS